MDEKSLEDQRQELLEVARELIATMRQIIEPVNKISCKLDAEAGSMLPRVLDERPNLTRRKKKIVYGKEPKEEKVRPLVEAGKRACSICRKPGHRSTTCPERG